MKKITIILSIFLLFIIFIGLKETNKNEEIVKGINNNYTYNVKYPLYKNNEFNNKLKNITTNYINKYKGNSNLIINYKILRYKNLNQIIMYIKINKSFNKQINKTLIYYYNKSINKEVKYDDIFKNDYQNKIKELSNIDINNNILFDYKGINIYKNETTKEIIKYKDIYTYLNEEYINELDKDIKNIIKEMKRYKGKKIVSITFDDGPSKNTNYLLDELKIRNVKATFFLVGYNILKYEDAIKKMQKDGHLIGNHTYNHYNLNKLNIDQVKNEVQLVDDMIFKLTRETTKVIRPPYGNYTDEMLININKSFIIWSLDTLDWKSRNADMVYNAIINNVQDGDIILLHDLYSTSVEGALRAIDYLKKNNFEFVTVEKLAQLKNKKIETNKKYSDFY